jgi:hypothetical protein
MQQEKEAKMKAEKERLNKLKNPTMNKIEETKRMDEQSEADSRVSMAMDEIMGDTELDPKKKNRLPNPNAKSLTKENLNKL